MNALHDRLEQALAANAAALARHSPPRFLIAVRRMMADVRRLAAAATRSEITLLLAAKAVPDARLVRRLAEHVAGFDLSNAAEYAAFRRHLRRRHRVSLTGPLISTLRPAATTADRFVNVDHRSDFAARRAGIAGIGIRIRSPHAGTLHPEAYASRFGFEPAEAIALIRKFPAAVRGLHLHPSIRPGDVASFAATARMLKRIAAATGHSLRYVNLGGGLAGLSDEALGELFSAARAAFPRPLRLLFEPGKAFFERSIFLAGRVVACDALPAQRIFRVRTTISRDCHLKWSDPQLLFPRFGARGRKWTVMLEGPTCEESDVVGTFPARCGSVAELERAFSSHVVLSGVSPYSVLWNRSFNGVSRAAVMLRDL